MQKVLNFLLRVELCTVRFFQIFNAEIYWVFGNIGNNAYSI